MQETLPVRPGEEVDTERLGRYLRSAIGADDTPIRIEQFPAGSSNLTYLISIDKAEYVLRRPPFGNTVKSAHDMSREFNVLSKLSTAFAPAPRPLLFCDDTSVIGSEFYLMERRNGLIIRGRAPREIEASPALQNKVAESFIANLADLHRLKYRSVGLGDLGRPEGYNRRQVEGWTNRYFAAKTHEWSALEQVIVWLGQNIPPDGGAALVHNDYKFDNVMLDPTDLTRVTAVLDWEMVTVGNPLMDLGTTLGYWMSSDAGEHMLNMPFNPRVLMENISRAELVEIYAQASGSDVGDILYYYVFGTFKIAVIAQQIYSRYARGLTADRRFERFDSFVSALGEIASKAVSSGRI